MDSGRFENLLERYQLGEAAAAEIAELEQLLRADAAARRSFVHHFLLEVHLHKAFATTSASTESDRPTPPRSLRRLGAGLVAAVVLLAAGLGLLSYFSRPNPQPDPIASARVLAGEVRVDGETRVQIPDDAPFDVVGNTPALVRLADGSQAELSPGSQAVIHGRQGTARLAVQLDLGTGKFQVAAGQGPFRVETGVGTVTALGTEFTVKLQARGKSKRRSGTTAKLAMIVTVTEGSVRVESRGRTAVLGPGETRTFGDGAKHEEDDD